MLILNLQKMYRSFKRVEMIGEMKWNIKLLLSISLEWILVDYVKSKRVTVDYVHSAVHM